jgi:hypothetical protein
MNTKGLLMGAAFAATMGAAVPARAGIIYQSIPDLTAAPSINGFCSQCGSDGQIVGQAFSVASSAVATTLSFDATSYYLWPSPVTVNIFQDGGSNTLGNNIYNNTFSSFASDVSTGHGTDLVTVNIGAVALAAGSYELFITNHNWFTVPGYGGYAGNQIAGQVGSGSGPSSGDGYNFIGGSDAGVQIAGAAPEPSTWAMMGLGFVGLGLAGYRSRRTVAPIA